MELVVERIAEYCYNTADFFIKAATNDRCWVEKVEVFEHEDNSVVFTKIVTQTMRFTEVLSIVKHTPTTQETSTGMLIS